ncbi:MAG: NAD-glutamate dehydrogenase [Hahellaceae bacterium]|nr:NAD-glutamate dehydrogenase [Hahellaceae bacterium]
MNLVNTNNKAVFLKDLADTLEKNLDPQNARCITDFAFQYFGGLPMEEFKGRRFSDVYGAAISCWSFLQHHKPDTPKVRVFNPNLEENGWQSTHTVVAVLHQNMPFLIDSLRMLLSQRELTIHSIQHTVLYIDRTPDGHLKELLPRKGTSPIEKSEALMFVEVDRHNNDDDLKSLSEAIYHLLGDVRIAVADFESMKSKTAMLIAELQSDECGIANVESKNEAIDFVKWLAKDHFTFLGYVEYELKVSKKERYLEQVKGSELGILRGHSDSGKRVKLADLPERTQQVILGQDVLVFAKSAERSRIHRPAYPDYISVKRFDAQGNVIGECRFLGLYTATVYSERISQIPILRRKAAEVINRSGLSIRDYGGKELEQILAVYPRDELFQSSVEELYDVALSVLYIQERRKIRLFMREDAYGSFVYCLVYVPRDIYNTDLRRKIEAVLMQALDGQDIDFTTYFSESVLARTQFNIKVRPTEQRELNTAELQDQILALAQSWQDGLTEAMYEVYGEEQANDYIHLYSNAFGTGYQEVFSPRRAVIDVDHIARVTGGEKTLGMSFYRSLSEDEYVLHFKLFHSNDPLPLSDVLPIFENMGLKVIGEHPYETRDRNGARVWIHDFSLMAYTRQIVDIQKVRGIFEELFEKVWSGEAENDSFNRLVLGSYMDWRNIAVLRAYARYMRQIRVTNSQEFIALTLGNHVNITSMLLSLFRARFNPEEWKSDTKYGAVHQKLEIEFNAALDAVSNLSEDKVLRLYWDLICATLRTNFYQKNAEGQLKPYISFKFKPDMIPEVPLPVPLFEIFVYSPRIEGVHLRGGKVARGGLRWSDRFEDYRTEVLGLVKAQQVKNAVIVPVGAKGGFVAKQLPDGDREAWLKEGIACYQTFVRGLLDITDNLSAGEVVPPSAVIRHDEDDIYLVVAADKGTATFSDIANALSKEYNFWLGDAFASGGSNGYDHKKMGITAKGAWVSVERHFRELGINPATTPFTCTGIGDMSGDVFGNGLLRSEQTRLVAAFNHMHIFLDPNPDMAASFAERLRLFNLPRSSWADYQPDLISKGGGVFSRAAKSIPISPEVKALLGVKADKLPPNMLITYILKAQVDLLWIGGIGTYVKSEEESHAEVGDKANDGVRINGRELGARVVGEGGNLGCTQLGRIEYSLRGGRLNTDFIDNAGGVDCSDHEVNIKILLNRIVAAGDLTEKQRNQVLSEMTNEVGALVLANNYKQTQAISIAVSDGVVRLEEYRRLISTLENAGKLNRELEFMPDDEMLMERKVKEQGLTRPEISILISYVKGVLKETLINGDMTDDASLNGEMLAMFPRQICDRFGQALTEHPLRKEIIATKIANDMVNHTGITFVDRLRQSTGASVQAVALAYIIARDVYALEDFWTEIEALDYKVPAQAQIFMMRELMRLVRRACRWLLRNRRSELNVAANMERFSTGIRVISEGLRNSLTGSSKQEWDIAFNELTGQGVPESLAEKIAGVNHLYSALGIIEAQEQTGAPLADVASTYYAVGSRLSLEWFATQLNKLKPLTHWQALARETFREDLDWQQRALTVGILKMKNAPAQIEKRMEGWLDYHQELVDRWSLMVNELKATKDAEYSMYSVALRELLDLAQSTTHSANT